MKTSIVSFKVSDEEKDRLVEIAKQRDISLSQLIREAIRAYIQKEEK